MKTIKASEADSAKTYEAYIERDKVIAVDAELPLNHIENYLKVRNDPEQKNMDPNQYVDLRYQAKAKQEGIH
ncbi:MAG TPA: hypothetical protein VK138_00800 [Acidiferrobacterales bacterium]|nr:hypothetical protein [Acidiferrobacterales bacterium]